MKLWIAIGLLSLIIDCGGSTDVSAPTVTNDAPRYDRDERELPEKDGGDVGPCDRRRDVVTFKLDGGTFEISVPVLCDPTPYLEKGDPPWRTPSLQH